MPDSADKTLLRIFRIAGDFFSSIKLAIALFTAIALIGAIGLFFPNFLFYLFIPAILLSINLLFCISKRLFPCLTAGKIDLQKAGIILIHISIILILLALAIGYLRSWSSSMQIAEGETINLPDKIKNISEPVSIYCRKFDIDYYPDTRPKDFRAELVFHSGGNSLTSIVSVNNPVNFNGVNFYLASYGQIPGRAVLTINKHGKLMRQTDVHGQTSISARDSKINVLRIEEDVSKFGPAVKIRVKMGGISSDLWIMQNIVQMQKKYPRLLKEMPPLNPAPFAPYTFSFSLEKDKHYIVLDMKRDPGILPAAAGAIMLLAGVLLVLIAQHNKKNGKSPESGKDGEGVPHG
jgi:hypothetical protein